MANFDHLQQLFTGAMKLAAAESGVLLGQPLEVQAEEFQLIEREEFLGEKEGPFFVTTVVSAGEYPGELQLLLSFRDAILLSGLLLGIPPARIEEKRKLAIMEADDGDAFAEILNQVIGSFNSEFSTSFPRKTHLKSLPPRKFIPGTDLPSAQEPVPEGEYCLLRYRLKLENLKTDQLEILVPLALARLFDPREESVAAEQESPLLSTETGFDSNSSAGPLQTIFILENDPSDRRLAREILATTGLKLIDAPLSADFRSLCPEGEACMAVIGVSDADDQDPALRAKISALCHDASIPILLCAERWTRRSVMKVLSYGARGIILKPYDAAILVERVTNLLKAA